MIDLFAQRHRLGALGACEKALEEQVQALETNLEVIERAVELFRVEHDPAS